VADVGDEHVTAELRRIRDREEIADLKARYCRLVDTQDWASFATLLTDDYVLYNGTTRVEGRAAAVSMVSGGLADGSSVHHVFNPEIDVTGDVATAIWPLEDWAYLSIGGQRRVFHGFGHYHEEYARTGDGWRIASTTITRLRMDEVDPEPATPQVTGER
jgi:ketosteroid isomerase-like protein